jgi:Protein of unknown function (DUF3048) N-terminal domain/Protein of unknown function (DUF3048) C-terminal domain
MPTALLSGYAASAGLTTATPVREPGVAPGAASLMAATLMPTLYRRMASTLRAVNTRRALGALVAITVIATGCNRSDTADTTTSTALTTLPPVTTTVPQTTTSSTTTTSTEPPPPVDVAYSPLNGLPVYDTEALQHRVIAVKIDNHWDARPQTGLLEAQAVYELLVEGGLTRFIPLYHQSSPTYIGPIRSGRPTDPTLLKYIGAPVQVSGMQDWVAGRFVSAGVHIIGDDQVSTFRIGSRRAPHNLYGSVETMRQTADNRGWPDTPPQPIFDFGDPSTSDVPATEIALDWSDRPVVRWEWNGFRYFRYNDTTPHMAVTRDGIATQLNADVMVVLEANRYTAAPQGPGTPVPALDTLGTGKALLFHDGIVVEGTWARDTIEERFELTLDSGEPMVLPAGRLWINVFPQQQTVTWTG